MELTSYNLFVWYDLDYLEMQYCTRDDLLDDFSLVPFNFFNVAGLFSGQLFGFTQW